MKHLKIVYLIILLMASSMHLEAINIKVRLLSEFDVKSVDFKVISGQYMLLCDNARTLSEDLNVGDAVTLSVYYKGRISSDFESFNVC